MNESAYSFPAQDIDAVYSRLKKTFSHGKTRDLPWRKAQLKQLEKMLRDNEPALIQALNDDLGKSETEAWTAEIGFLLSDIRHTLKHLQHWAELRPVSTPLAAQPGRSYLLPEPLGTVLIIGAWNYPLQLVLAPFIAAVAAGNCAVLKPSELSPACATLLTTLIPQYLDEQAVAVVEGGKETAQALLAMRWDHIFYTGGEVVGKIVMPAAAQYLTPVTLELGGKSPCLVDEQSDIAIAARRIVWGKWMNCGQTCIAPDYVLVASSVADELVVALRQEIENQYGKTPINSNDYGRIVNASHFQRLSKLLDEMQIVAGGETDETKLKIAPTIVLNPSYDSDLMQQEIFGPILPVLTVEDMAEACDIVVTRPKPLALYLFTQNDKTEASVLAKTSAGSVCVNDTMMFMANQKLPFGGVGTSGMGRYHGQYGFDTFSHLKSVMHRSTKMDVKVRYAPYSSWKLWLLKKLL